MIAGGVDFNLNKHFLEGMELLGANNDKYNDDPAHASMPFDTQRSGPVMSDGGGFVVLETLESALSRTPRPKIYCEVSGYS